MTPPQRTGSKNHFIIHSFGGSRQARGLFVCEGLIMAKKTEKKSDKQSNTVKLNGKTWDIVAEAGNTIAIQNGNDRICVLKSAVSK